MIYNMVIDSWKRNKDYDMAIDLKQTDADQTDALQCVKLSCVEVVRG